MKKNIIIILALFLSVLVPSVSAQTYVNDTTVVLPAETVVEETYFAAGDSVMVLGIVNGDAYVAGGTVLVNGTVNGDLLAAGGTINVNGNITGDIRVAGGQVNIDGTVGGNITVAGGNVNIADSAEIAGGVVGAGGQVNIMAPLGGGIVVGAGQLTVSDTINGNVLAGVGNLVLTPTSRINGNLTYYSEQEVTIPQEATVSGNIDFHEQKTTRLPSDQNRVKEGTAKALGTAMLMWIVYSLITSFIAGAILIRLAPRFMNHTSDIVHNRPWMSMGIGLLTLIVTPIIAIILLITILGIPFALFLLAMYIITICLSKIFVALYLGQKMLGLFKWQDNRYLALFLGLLAIMLVTAVPVFGWLIGFIVTITGVGALLITKKDFYVQLKAKNVL